MDGFQWRGAARIVAYLDVVLTSLALFVVIYVTTVHGIFTGVANNPDLTKNSYSHPDQGKIYHFASGEDSSATINWVVWVIVASLIVLILVHLWAAVQLLKATAPGRPLYEALKHATSWCDVTVVILVFKIFGLLFTGRYISSAIGIVTRVTFLYIGCKFMSEVRFHLNARNSAGAPETLTAVTRKD